ncbi:MAG: amidohydrolase [Dissulfurispiraceae bacterium]|jgi:5-methylthioadenosine/S-adenosylhomocysteine deaminase
MEQVDYIIHGDHILTMNDRLDIVHDGAVAVKNGVISDVGLSVDILKKYTASRTIGGCGKLVLPGFVNTHTHAAMVYFRGLADDLPLKEWLEKHIWPAEDRLLSAEFVYDAVLLACLEMLKSGVTTYNDMYFFGDSAARASKQLGMRALLGVGILDFPSMTAKTVDEYLGNADRFIGFWKGDPLITPCIAPHSAYACSTQTLVRVKELADRRDVLTSIHVSETAWEVDELSRRYGKKPVEYLENIGFLSDRLLAAHCVWLDDLEIDLLAERGVAVSHCIESNLKMASGIAPVPKMLAAGVKVSLGTDGAASNNDLNILSEMSTAAKVHKAAANDPTVVDSKTALLMATRWGAEALGLGSQVGSIEPGKRADLLTLNMLRPHLTPAYDLYSLIVYAAMASDIEDVLVDGTLVIEGRALVTGDEEAILQKAYEWSRKVISKGQGSGVKGQV